MSARYIVGALAVVLAVVALLLPHPAAADGTVSRVVDGDTIVLMLDGQEVKYRQLGVDTPETKHPTKGRECGGPEATAFAQQFFDGQRVTVRLDASQDPTDRYGRALAYLEVGGKDYGQAVITAGWAREKTYDGKYDRQFTYRAVEKVARIQRKGLWKECKR